MTIKPEYIFNVRKISIAFVLTVAIALFAGKSSMLTGHAVEFDLDTGNYVGTHNFQVTIEGFDGVNFNTEFITVDGLETETKLDKKGKLKTTYEPIRMERIYKGVDALYAWRLEIEEDILIKRNIRVDMMDSAFRIVRSVVIYDAWPSKWEMPDMEAGQSGPAIERMTFEGNRVVEE